MHPLKSLPPHWAHWATGLQPPPWPGLEVVVGAAALVDVTMVVGAAFVVVGSGAGLPDPGLAPQVKGSGPGGHHCQHNTLLGCLGMSVGVQVMNTSQGRLTGNHVAAAAHGVDVDQQTRVIGL